MIQDKIFFDEKDPTGLSYNTPFTFYGSYQGRLWSKSPSGSIQYYTQNSDLSAYATTGSNQFSGSQAITGSLTVTGTITGTVAGTTATASYVEYTNVANKPALVSGSSQVTYSGLTGIPSGIVSGSAQISNFGIFATTGSNGFNGSQSITGSLTVTGQVVAQTLNVQQVTSSIVYSSGSNVFGNSLSNTQQFTGSLQVSGSSHYVLGNVGIGTSSPQANLQVLGTIKVATGNAQGILGLGEGNGSTVNVGLWRGAANAPTTDGNFLNLGGYDGIVFATGNAAIGSQTTRLTISSTGAATFSSTVTATQYTATSTGGSGLRIYGASGTNQWDMYLNGANIRFSDNTGTGSFVVDRPATFSSSVSATTLSLSATVADYAATITNVQDDSQGLLVRATDNDGGLYLIRAQSSNSSTSQTWVDRFVVAKNGAATFSSSVQTGNNITVNSSTYNWYSSSNVAFRVVDFGQYGSVYSYQDGAYYSGFAHNTYFASGTFDWRYKNTGGASNFYFQNGNLYFETAASGTAGTAAALSTKFYITSGGNVLIGDTSNASGSPTFYVKNKAGAVANIAGWNFGGTTTAENGNNNLLTSGAYYNGSSMVATQTTSTGYQQYSGVHIFYTDSGLTPGNTYSNTERMRITSGGALQMSNNSTTFSIGSIAGVQRVQFGTGGFTTEFQFLGTNDGYAPIGASAFNTRSDYRLKEDLQEFSGLSLVTDMKVYDFKWKEQNERNYGFMAHELQEIVPYVVTGTKDGMFEDEPQMQGLDHSKLVPVLVKAIQELSAKIETLEAEIQTLKQQ